MSFRWFYRETDPYGHGKVSPSIDDTGGTVKFLLCSSGISNRASTTRWSNCSANRLPSSTRSASPPGATYDESEPLTGSEKALGLVDFSVFPHLEREDMPDTSLANIEKWAAGIPVPAYAIDDQTAIKVVDGAVEVVSEGHWKLFTP
jgi:hypothetical protein